MLARQSQTHVSNFSKYVNGYEKVPPRIVDCLSKYLKMSNKKVTNMFNKSYVDCGKK